MFKISKQLIKVPDMIGSFACSPTASLVAKNGTRKIIPLLDKIITSGQILVFEVSK